jgi:hypothetical protein
MLTHPPWTRLESVRHRLCKLGRRVAGHLLRLLSDSLGEAVRTAIDAFLRGGSEPPPTQPVEPASPQPLPVAPPKPETPSPLPAEKPVSRWQWIRGTAVCVLTWLGLNLPRQHPILTPILLVSGAFVGRWMMSPASPFSSE